MRDAPNHALSSPIAQGRTAEIYDWDEGHILKLYHTWCPPHWVEHEARVARTISAAGIPTPAAGEIVERAGRRGIIYERVRGVSMLADLRRRPWLLLHYARDLADLQARFHRLSVPGVGDYRAALRHDIGHAPHLSEEVRGRVLVALAALPDGAALCHGDFHPLRGDVQKIMAGETGQKYMASGGGNPIRSILAMRQMLSVTISFDHDIVDGAPAARFA